MPDRVLLAELHGSEAFDVLKLLTTGHSGAITSFPAQSCALAGSAMRSWKEHADAARPVVLLLSEGQMSDYKGTAFMLDSFSPVSELMADKRCDSDWFREALQQRGIKPAPIPSSQK